MTQIMVETRERIRSNGEKFYRSFANLKHSSRSQTSHLTFVKVALLTLSTQPLSPLHKIFMAPALTTSAPDPAAPLSAINTGFRLGDGHASDTDSDQSAASERSISPQRKGLPKSRKRKERKEFGALAHDLSDIMGAAFTGPAAAGNATANTTQADGDQEMLLEGNQVGKKMNKRTRQNLERMEARRLKRDQADMAAAQRSGLTLEAYRAQIDPPNAKLEGAKQGKALRNFNAAERRSLTANQSKDVKKSRTEGRRARKKERRQKSKAEESERMDVD